MSKRTPKGSEQPRSASNALDLTPKFVTAIREGYTSADLRADALAGLTVAIVALPLSMAIAIASGVPPERGLYAAIVGGFIVSLLGGSRYQIGGPAGAFIVLLATIVERHGYDGLVLATAMAGVIMIAVGVLRLGTYVRFVPFPVVVGFSAGIATIIFASQLKELLGLRLAAEPAELLPKLVAIATHLHTINPMALAISLLSIGLILGLRQYRPNWPGMLVAVAIAAIVTSLLGLDVTTIGSRFGGLPQSLPSPSFPAFSLARLVALLPDAVSLALLGSIESLLSALVADSMSGRRHRSNIELVAQGAANIGSVIFGGITVTGTIARTATNVRAGARTPVAGMLHCFYLLAFMLVAAPLATYIPLAALGGVLTIVAWNMADADKFRGLLGASPGDAATVVVTFLLTIFVDLTMAIVGGVALGSLVVLQRLAQTIDIEGGARPSGAILTTPILLEHATSPGDQPVETVVRLTGALFFGTSDRIGRTLDEIGPQPRRIVLDMREVTIVDSSAAAILLEFAERRAKLGTVVVIAGAPRAVRRRLMLAGLGKPAVRYVRSLPNSPPIRS